MVPRAPLLLAAIMGLIGAPCLDEARAADPDKDGVFNIQIENDLFGDGDDRFYTNGLRLSYFSPTISEGQRWVPQLARLLPMFPDAAKLRISFALGQNIYTPDDITTREVIRDDRPYAGWLYGGIGLVAEHNDTIDNVELDIGIVGPGSLAEPTQTYWHEFIDTTRPEGWDNQLKNEPAVVLFYERKFLGLPRLEAFGHQLEFAPSLGFALGNVFTHAAAGTTLRFGRNLPTDYGPPRIRPSLPGSGFFRGSNGFAWYLFAGIEGRAVAYNIFLDGNTIRDSHDVPRRPLVGDFQAGIAATWGDVRLSFTHTLRTKEFDGQPENAEFGALSLSVRF